MRCSARLARGERADGDGPAAELAATLDPEDPARAEELVAIYLEGKGLPLAGNRTLAEIAARLIDHAKDLRAEPLRAEIATVIDYYLAVDAPPREAVERIAMIAKGAGLDLGRPLDLVSAAFRAAGGERHRLGQRALRHRLRPRPRILFRHGVSDRGRQRWNKPGRRRRAL